MPMPDFKASKNRLNFVVNAAGDFKLKSMLTYQSKIPGALKHHTQFILCSINKLRKPR